MLLRNRLQSNGVLRTSGLMLAMFGGCTALMAQSITWLGVLPGGSTSWAYGISNDGSVVVGHTEFPNGEWRAFRWTSGGGMVNLGTLPNGYRTVAFRVSGDGNVVVGVDIDGSTNQRRAYRWDSNGMTYLGTLGSSGSWSYAYDASFNGSIIAGVSDTTDLGLVWHAFRWTSGTGMVDLGTPPGGGMSWGFGITDNGNAVVGMAEISSGGPRHAVFWSSASGMKDLGTLGGSESRAWAISGSGGFIVGAAQTSTGDWRATLWEFEEPWIWMRYNLGTLPGDISSEAYGISANGQVVVGWSENSSGGRRAFRWKSGVGMQDLNTLYACLLTDGSVLYEARDTSSDGRYIVGRGYNAATGRDEAYLLDTLCTAHNGDVNSDGCVDDADLLAVLFAFGQTSSCLGRVDVNCDGTVDDADLLIVLFNFGSGC